MIRSPHFQPYPQQTNPASRRPDRQARTREDRPRSHERGHRCHDIRCQEADQEIREALGRFSIR